MLSALFAKIGLPVLVSVLSDSLKKVRHPAAQGAAAALETLETSLQNHEIPTEQIEEANRHAEKMAEMAWQEQAATLSEVNQSLRAEVASEDPYVRRMRPTFGYLMALTWAAQMLAIAYVMVFRTAESNLVIEAMGSLSMIWTVGLSVLGIYVYKRSEDKRLGL
ncbi:MAG: ribokinase [Alphaproteobacteria bacterium]|nr:ribokinase [Alphaproteobacteria bacterium]